MKKTLLTTTAISMFAAGSAFAASPTVTVGGYADFQVGNGDQNGLYEAQSNDNDANLDNDSIYSRNLHTRTDTEIHISVDGKTDGGLGYGAYIELEADVNQDDTTGANNNSEISYVYIESGFGRVEAGPTGDAGNALKVDASNIARATGGIAGDFYQYVDLSQDSAHSAANYYILPGLPSAVGLPGEANAGETTGANHEARANANKVSYYSPRIQGAQIGISYTPDQGERGTAAGFSSGDNSTIEDVWNVGLNYEGQINDIGIEASVSAETGDIEDAGTVAATADDLKAFAIGASAAYAGVTVAGSYGDVSEYGQTATFNSEADYWTLGAAYEFGPFAASVTYLSSEIENDGAANAMDREFTNLSVGADYKLAPGLVPYVEVSFFDTDDNVADTATVADNDGTVIIVGTELNF